MSRRYDSDQITGGNNRGGYNYLADFLCLSAGLFIALLPIMALTGHLDPKLLWLRDTYIGILVVINIGVFAFISTVAKHVGVLKRTVLSVILGSVFSGSAFMLFILFKCPCDQ